VHTAPSLPSLLRTTGLIKLEKEAPGVVALLLQYWSPPATSRCLCLYLYFVVFLYKSGSMVLERFSLSLFFYACPQRGQGIRS